MRYLQPPKRLGFTVLELLVVIAVITLLMSILVGATFRFVASARESATVATITKANGLIQDRVRAFREHDFSDAAIVGRDSWNFNYPSSKIDAGLAEVLIRKSRFKKAFPQAFNELDASQTARFFPTNYPPTGSYQPKYESGIVLYAVLTKGDTFGATSPGDDAFTGSEIKNSAETGFLPCLVDAWGEPIRFYRWPTRLIRCGELDLDGDGTFDDYNQNGSQEAAGSIDNTGIRIFGPAIRPFAPAVPPLPFVAGRTGPTPASLLIANLPPFERNNRSYVNGPDGVPGAPSIPSGFNGDDDNKNGPDDAGEVGWPDTDDPEPLNTDPDDPLFRLSSFLATTALQKQFVMGSSANTYTDAYHDFFTFHTPLLVSAGQDKQLGLWEPTDVPTVSNPTSINFGYLANPRLRSGSDPMRDLFDNITNLNQRAGGK